MENEITIPVRIVSDGEGRFVGRAVGYPGVIVSGDTQEEVMQRIEVVWHKMAQISAIKSVGNAKRPIYKGSAKEIDLRLQVA